MTGKTHITGGFVLGLCLTQDFVSLILTCVGSILPDIDHPNSALGKLAPFISKVFKHRGFLHSIWVPIGLFFISRPLAYGYIMHLCMDAITVQGIKPFNPLFNKVKLRIPLVKTGSTTENIIFMLLCGVALTMFYINYISPIVVPYVNGLTNHLTNIT